ncbi:MAG: DUF1192 domain-containing protein [Mesorhizobium amorphae]|nr:MAG: DUF1192 domain-containing protein [Mesorhizobium amorphae]
MSVEDAQPTRRPVHEIGQDLALLSADELETRIEALKLEIARLEAEIGTKQSSRAAADAFFKL